MGMLDDFGVARDVAVTVLVDNHADLMVESTDSVKYFTDAPLLAEHGLAALIHLKDPDIKILWDAGLTEIVLMENAQRMELDLASIDKIVLSHGHRDHTASVSRVLREIDCRPEPRKWEADASMAEMIEWATGRRVPVVAHPAAFRERWGTRKKGGKYGPVLPPPRQEWEALGAEVIQTEDPYELGPGCWTTSGVPRLSFEKSGIPERLTYRDGDEFVSDHVEEDQAIAINVEQKGLVVVSGCAHSGIVNTVNHARDISGVDRVWAILGGFHLARAEDDEIQRTVDAVKSFAPQLIVPSHCTGFKAQRLFAAEMPDVFLPGVVGATYLF